MNSFSDEAFDELDEEQHGFHYNSICHEYGIEHFPMAIWGDAESPEYYNNRHELDNYEVLSKFAQANISKPVCTVQRLQYCNDDERKMLDELMSKSIDELEKMELDIEQKLQEPEEKYQAGVRKIQEQHQALLDQYNEDIWRVRQETNFKWIQMVLGEKDAREYENAAQQDL